MIAKQLQEIINGGEGLTVEFKECRSRVNRDVYESICAFLNRNGGHIILGVRDDGGISGIDPVALSEIKTDLVTTLNNLQKINPPLYVLPETITIEGKLLLYLAIPESSQVHRCAGKILDRNEDGDLDITNQADSVAHLYIRKQSTFSENRIYPYVRTDDLRSDIIQRIKEMVRADNPNHPWVGMNDEALLQSARLYQRDYQSGKEGYTLAAVLLVGKDGVIQSVAPQYRTDAILRRINQDRYDDRDDIRTNLLDSYDRLMAFVTKHLPDPFYLEKDRRISLRDRIFREVVTNILIHREYLSGLPAKFIIESNQVRTENGNRPHGHGTINPSNFTPYPKNPVIARFFKEIGRADELGSGVRNLFKYTRNYSGGVDPQLIEADIFRIVIPTPQATPQVTPQATPQDIVSRMIAFCRTARTAKEMMDYLGLKDRKHFRTEVLNPLINQKKLAMKFPDKPRSPKQKYYSPNIGPSKTV
jgi:ATP-dependent DNA helicase RecG